MNDKHTRKAHAGDMKRIAAAIFAACALAACQHLPDFGTNEAPTRAQEPKAKHRTLAKPPATARVALRGTQSDQEAVETSDASPERAGKLRALALDQLNRGEVDGAVANLKAARELDPDNELILRDLERAHRIRAAVSAQPK